jgi:TorA maturation chaperone TorD
MTVHLTNPEIVSNEEVAEATLGAVLVADLDRDTVIVALDLLAHWWSRPTVDEGALWARAADLEEFVSKKMANESPRLASSSYDTAALLEEYERLFVGPGPVNCSPYESYWRNDVSVDIRRSLMGPCTADLIQLYGEIGLEVARVSGELPDHIAIELEALAYSLSLDNGEAVTQSLFFDHLMKWLSRLCRAVTHEAELPFYKDLAEITVRWKGPIKLFFESIALSDSTTG